MFRSKQILLLVLVILISIYAIKLFLNKKLVQKNSPESTKLVKTQELDISICDPSKGPFSATIDNPFFPYPVGKINILAGPVNKVQISSLDRTEIVAGVETRVIEEREWSNGELAETSLNYFARAPDGTVCYFGEDVDIYENGRIVSHEGAWRAGVGQNKPGIMMPAFPAAGQSYQQEVAPGVASDRAEHLSLGGSVSTPVGIFPNVLLVKETPDSTKRYAEGVGLIFDDGDVLTEY